MRRVLRHVKGLVGFSLLLAACLPVSLWAHFQLPVTRRVVADLLNDFVSQEIRGRLYVEHISNLSFQGLALSVNVQNAYLYDPNDEQVLHAPALHLEVAMLPIARGILRFPRAELMGGHVQLRDGDGPLPSLLESFEIARDGPPGTGDPLHAILEHVVLHDVTLEGQVLGLAGLQVRHIEAHAHFDIQRAVRVRVHDLIGEVRAPFATPIQIDGARGVISSLAHEGIQLDAELSPPNEYATAKLRYAQATDVPEDTPFTLDLDIEAKPVSAHTLTALGFDWAAPLATTIHGSLRLQGPIEDLALQSALQLDGGPLVLSGHIRSAEGISLTATSDGLRLDRVMQVLPSATIRGRAELSVPPADTLVRPTARLELDPFTFDQFSVPRTTTALIVEDDGLRLDSIRGWRPGAQIRGHGRVGFDGEVSLEVQAQMAEIADDPNLRRHWPGARGTAEGQLSMYLAPGTSRTVHFQGQVTLRNFRDGPLRAALLQLQGKAHGDALRPRVDLKVHGHELAINHYPLGRAELEIRGGPSTYVARGIFERQGTRTFDLEANIRADAKGFAVEAEEIELVVGDRSWRGMLRGLYFAPGELVSLELLRLASRSQRLEAKGTIQFDGDDDIDLLLQDFDLTALSTLIGREFAIPHGRADATLRLTGDLQHPSVEIQGALREGRVGTVDDIHSVYFATYRDGWLEVDGEATLGTRGAFTLQGMGQVDPTTSDPLVALRQGAYELTLQVESLDIKAVRDLFQLESWPDAEARIAGRFVARGTIDAPAFDGDLQAQDVRVPGWDALAFTSELQYAEAKLQAALTVADDHGELTHARVALPLDVMAFIQAPSDPRTLAVSRSWQLELQTVRRRLDQLPKPFDSYVPLPLVLQSEIIAVKDGDELTADWRFSGDLEDIPLETTCAADANGHVEGAVRLSGDLATFHLEGLVGADNTVTLRGAAPTHVLDWMSGLMPTSWPATDLTVETRVREARDVPWLCRYIDGDVRAIVRGEQLFSEHPLVTAEVLSQIDPYGPKATTRGERLCPTEPIALQVRIQADDRSVEAQGKVSGCGGGPADLQARVPIAWTLNDWPHVTNDRDIEATLDLYGSQLRALLTPLPGIVEAEGLGTGTVRLHGTAAAPQLGGRIDLQHGGLRLAGSGQTLSDIGGTLLLQGNTIELDRVVAYDGSGAVRLDGKLHLVGLRPEAANLDVALSRFPTRYEGISLSFLSGSADVAAQIQPDRTGLDIDLNRLEVRLPEDTGRTLQSLDPHTDVELAGAAPVQEQKPYALQIRLDGRKTFLVRRHDFEALVRSELDIVYKDPELRVSGYVEFQRGHFEVFGKRFEIEQGSLSFSGNPQLNPAVNLRAVHRPRTAGASTVTVSISGYLEAPRVTFTSPACDGQSGALAMLLGGTCSRSNQLNQGEETAMAAGLVSGVLTLGAQRELGRLMPSISIESAGHSYHTRVRARFDANVLIPHFLRNIVRQAYLQGAVSSTDPGAAGAPVVHTTPTGNPTTDLMLELYFPHSLVGTGMVSPQAQRWGIDLSWEP